MITRRRPRDEWELRPPAAFSASERAWIRSSSSLPGWWPGMAENPTCLPWCEWFEHDVDEFRFDQSLTCRRGFGLDNQGHVLVAVCATVAADPDVPWKLLEPELWIEVWAEVQGEQFDVERAAQLERALSEGRRFLAGLVTK